MHITIKFRTLDKISDNPPSGMEIYGTEHIEIFGIGVTYKWIDIGLLYVTWGSNKTGWFRLFKYRYGIHWKHSNNRLTFSERYGHKKYWVLFGFRFKILYPIGRLVK